MNKKIDDYKNKKDKEANDTSQPNKPVLRGNRFKDYTIREPVDQPYDDNEIWKPKAGESIIGEYIACQEEMGRFNQKLYIMDTDRLDGGYDKLYGFVTLERQMKKVELHTVIEIVYNGRNREKNYHEYTVNYLYKPEKTEK